MRKSITITIAAEGRDKGKQFFIEELSAAKAEAWADRAISAAGKSGVDITEALMIGGMAGLVVAGMRAFVSAPYAEKKPLMDEMMQCVSYIPDPSQPHIKRRAEENEIEEVATLLTLREEVMQLHVGFFKDAVQLIRTAITTNRQTALNETSSDTPISPEPLAA